MHPGDVISYLEMCAREKMSLQRGMNYQLHSTHSVLLMSVRSGAPYADQVTDNGRVLLYEGHDESKSPMLADPKSVDQPLLTPTGGLTQNGQFYRAAEDFRNGERSPEVVRVYEKVRQGIWVYTGIFRLMDAWQELTGGRQVFRFKLAIMESEVGDDHRRLDLEHSRVIPTEVKVEVWRRDHGRCTECGASDNLHFDHIIPYSLGGSSMTAANVQLLCARHNISKSDRLI